MPALLDEPMSPGGWLCIGLVLRRCLFEIPDDIKAKEKVVKELGRAKLLVSTPERPGGCEARPAVGQLLANRELKPTCAPIAALWTTRS